MGWLAPVDIYCERTGPDFWAEPLNAVSNLAFIAAAVWGAATARRLGLRAPIVWVLIVMAGAIGVGSFLFHTFANHWSELADVLPIWSFVAVFVLTAMRFLGGLSARTVGVASLVIAAAALWVVTMATGEGNTAAAAAVGASDPLNGSGQYAPALVALLVFTGLAWRKRHAAAPWLMAASATFLVSLGFRTLDRDICASLPIGTHFLWHLMNGLMIGLLLQMLVRTGGFGRAPVQR